MNQAATPQPVAVLLSGRGSNLNALLEQSAGAPYRIVKVISDQSQAGGLAAAQRAGVATCALPVPKGMNRATYDNALAEQIDACAPTLVVLAGFMRILSAAFVSRYAGRLLNIHPSLLPLYPGLHTHRRVLADGAHEHGATVHFVIDALDAGPRVLQARVPVTPGESEESLAARVLAQEHKIYPLAVRWFCAGRLRCERMQVWLDGEELLQPVQLEDIEAGAAA